MANAMIDDIIIIIKYEEIFDLVGVCPWILELMFLSLADTFRNRRVDWRYST